MLNKINTAFFLAFFALLVFAGCSKDDVKPENASNKNDLVSFKIPKNSAIGIASDAFVYMFQKEVYVTVTSGANLGAVPVEFQVSPKATLTINGTQVKSNQATLNLNETLLLEVLAENGAKKSYNVLVQDGNPSVDRLIYDFKTKFNLPGVSLAFSNSTNHEIFYKKGYGFAIEEERLRAKPNQLYRLASVSKQFTALAIMKLVDNGMLSIHDQVFGNGGILEQEFKNVSALASEVTIEHLLSHTSGWTSSPDLMFTSPYNRQSLDELIGLVLSSTQKKPGSSFSYYNMGYGILGKVIEKVSGKKYENYLKEVLAEAGVDDIHVGKDKAGRRSNEVVYYSQDGYNGYGNNMDMIAAAGGVIASTEQMLKLLPYIDGKNDVKDILSSDVRDLMFTKVADAGNNFYALGWRGGHRLYPNSYFHSGNIAGTATMWVIGPDVNVVLLLNSRSYQSGFDDEMYYLLEKLIAEANKML